MKQVKSKLVTTSARRVVTRALQSLVCLTIALALIIGCAVQPPRLPVYVSTDSFGSLDIEKGHFVILPIQYPPSYRGDNALSQAIRESVSNGARKLGVKTLDTDSSGPSVFAQFPRSIGDVIEAVGARDYQGAFSVTVYKYNTDPASAPVAALASVQLIDVQKRRVIFQFVRNWSASETATRDVSVSPIQQLSREIENDVTAVFSDIDIAGSVHWYARWLQNRKERRTKPDVVATVIGDQKPYKSSVSIKIVAVSEIGVKRITVRNKQTSWEQIEEVQQGPHSRETVVPLDVDVSLAVGRNRIQIEVRDADDQPQTNDLEVFRGALPHPPRVLVVAPTGDQQNGKARNWYAKAAQSFAFRYLAAGADVTTSLGESDVQVKESIEEFGLRGDPILPGIVYFAGPVELVGDTITLILDDSPQKSTQRRIALPRDGELTGGNAVWLIDGCASSQETRESILSEGHKAKPDGVTNFPLVILAVDNCASGHTAGDDATTSMVEAIVSTYKDHSLVGFSAATGIALINSVRAAKSLLPMITVGTEVEHSAVDLGWLLAPLATGTDVSTSAKARGSIHMFFSNSPAQASWEDGSVKGGVFTYYLMRGILGDASGRGSTPTVSELSNFLRDKVTIATNSRQTPLMTTESGSLDEPVFDGIGNMKRVLAVVVGVGQPRAGNLVAGSRFAAEDAMKFKQLILKLSGNAQPDVRLLLGPDATLAQINGALDDAVAMSHKGSILILYFSSFGVSTKSEDRLVPRLGAFDTDPEHVALTTIRLDELERRLRSADADSKWLFIDGCILESPNLR